MSEHIFRNGLMKQYKNDIQPECDRCGLCCSTYSFWMSNRSFDNDPKEIKRLILLHGCQPMKNDKGELGISIPIKCSALIFKDGQWTCALGDKRPVVCKEYFCERMIKKALERANGV
jgi:hypothetical protein